MSRPLRIQYADAFYHITSRGNEQKPIFKADKDRERFLSYLESAHERYGAIIHAYCLMDNHYHLLLETPWANLSEILHHINGAYTVYFNIRRQRSGHLFQGRYRAILVEKDVYCQELSRYIHLNPFRAGMVKNLRDYPWSSYRDYIGMSKTPWVETGNILGYFDSMKHRAQRKYLRYVEEAIEVAPNNPLKEVFASTFLGGEEFTNQVRERVKRVKGAEIRDLPVLRALAQRPSLREIEKTVEEVLGRNNPLFKKFCIHISHRHGGFKLKEIGGFYDMGDSAINQASRRLGQVIEKEPSLKRLVDQITKKLKSYNVET